EGKPADARSDVFSFGLVLYEMLTGRRAFAGQTSVATMAAILHKEPEPPGGPADLVRIVERCLLKDPAERYQSMAEIDAALDAVRPTPQIPSDTSRAHASHGSAGARPTAAFRGFAWAGVAALAVVAGFGVYRLSPHAEAIDSIAVLPLANAGGNPETE